MPNGATKGFTKIGDVKSTTLNNVNVGNVDKDINTNVNNVTSNEEKQISDLIYEYKDKPEAIAKYIAEKLSDTQNLNFHLKTVRLNNPQILLEALAIVLTAQREGKVRSTPAKYYVGILRIKGVRWR